VTENSVTQDFMSEVGERDGNVLFDRFYAPLILEHKLCRREGSLPNWLMDVIAEQCATETESAMLRFKAEIPDLSDELALAYSGAVKRALKVKLGVGII